MMENNKAPNLWAVHLEKLNNNDKAMDSLLEYDFTNDHLTIYSNSVCKAIRHKQMREKVMDG